MLRSISWEGRLKEWLKSQTASCDLYITRQDSSSPCMVFVLWCRLRIVLSCNVCQVKETEWLVLELWFVLQMSLLHINLVSIHICSSCCNSWKFLRHLSCFPAPSTVKDVEKGLVSIWWIKYFISVLCSLSVQCLIVPATQLSVSVPLYTWGRMHSWDATSCDSLRTRC